MKNTAQIFETATREPTPKSQEPLVPVSAPMSDEKTSSAYNAQDDLVYVIKQGSRLGYHFMAQLNTFADIKQCGFKPDFFRYKLAFQLSVEDSRGLFNNKVASTLPEHICQFDDSLERYSFRPYLHYGGWMGSWYVDEKWRCGKSVFRGRRLIRLQMWVTSCIQSNRGQ